jgi:hypothetical protein
MTAHRLRILGVATLLAVLGAFWISSTHNRTKTGDSGQALYPPLKGKLTSATRIRIYRAGDELIADLNRDHEDWHVANRNGYAADGAKVRKLLLDIEQARIDEQKTSNAANYPTLGVADVSDKAATGVRIEIEGLPTPVNLIVGKSNVADHTTFVRRTGEAPSWLVNVGMEVPSSTGEWLRKDILDVGADRIQQATIAITGEPAYTATKNSRTDANFTVAGIPKGRELNTPSAADGVATAVVGLELNDVKPAAEVSSEKPVARTVFHTFDGLVLAVNGAKQSDKYYITLEPAFDGALAQRFHVETEAATEKRTDTKAVDPNVKVEEEVKSLDSKLRPWAFEVARYKYDAIFKPLDQLLKKKEEKENDKTR